ncbi:HelD family protein [Aureliella helgolandensis]|uniref:DNA 3'-5' helicase n=1 Tax=Aureliella helgolandensis TaxID=2527968 RepID=A0A518G050_9BACT|nr:3'-5' exonuclease [Aureliella helgolandensis]QDV21971.1 Helicase IV [Aureliella helgolandensis]
MNLEIQYRTEAEERQLHQSITARLKETYRNLRADVAARHAEMIQIKQQLQDQIRDLDHVDKANLRQAANMASRVGEFSVEQQKRLERLIESPYFGRIDIQSVEHPSGKPLYIGVHSFSEDADRQFIHDWRAPISSLFYDFELGDGYYDAPDGQIEAQINLKRQYRIEKQQFRFMLESSLNILDNVLQEELSRASDTKLKTIVATIQRDQNAIIRNDDAHTMIIQGAAGSGKTSIAMHRIAYLLYKYKDTISSQDILIISPNNVFAHYISQVLPELGEEMISETTMEVLADVLLESKFNFQSFGEQIQVLLRGKDTAFAERVRYKASTDFLADFDRYVDSLRKSNVSSKGVKVSVYSVSAEDVRRHFQRRQNQPFNEQLNGVTAAIVEQIKLNHQKVIENKQRAELRAQLKAMMGETDLKKLYKGFYEWSGKADLFKIGPKGSLEYADVYPLIYMKLQLSNTTPNAAVKHLVVDEMQDYSPLQYRVLSQLYPCKKTVLGDRNQSVNPLSSSHAEAIRDILPESLCVYMRKSYRSTSQITQVAQAILNNPDLEPIARHGEEPTFNSFRKKSEELDFIAGQVKDFCGGEYQSMAIICRTQGEADELYEHLRSTTTVSLLNSKSRVFASGVVITTAYLAKGLEFDKVLVPFCTKTNYHQAIDRHMLYIAVTRAMHSLAITHRGAITEFLESVCSTRQFSDASSEEIAS